MSSASTDIEVINHEDVDISDAFVRNLVVYNDDVNTFNHVIECFMDILKHSYEQAEQCAMLIHTKGKCSVKSGEYDELKPLATSLLDQQLSCKIE